jgi:hypothetical protein
MGINHHAAAAGAAAAAGTDAVACPPLQLDTAGLCHSYLMLRSGQLPFFWLTAEQRGTVKFHVGPSWWKAGCSAGALSLHNAMPLAGCQRQVLKCSMRDHSSALLL